jgi:hypothetical protein
MSEEKKTKRNPYITVYGVSVKTHEELHNIADNIGQTLSDFMKPELRKIADSYPEHMKKAAKKD